MNKTTFASELKRICMREINKRLTDWIRLPGFGKDDFLARPGRWSRFALLHRHQVADIGENRFEVRHLRALWGRTESLTVPEPAVRGTWGDGWWRALWERRRADSAQDERGSSGEDDEDARARREHRFQTRCFDLRLFLRSITLKKRTNISMWSLYMS